jgi:hypothetical protein
LRKILTALCRPRPPPQYRNTPQNLPELDMDVARALFRLLIASAFAWLAFWGWRYGSGCIHAQGDTFFCPDASGQSLVRTDGLRMALHLLVPPLAGLAVCFWIWRNQRLAGD